MNYEQEGIKPYTNESGKTEQVEQMFDHIAPAYDKLNRRLSWNIDRRWRKRAIALLAKHQPKQILDVATGTGDFAILCAQKLKAEKIVGVDISEEMMSIGRKKAGQLGLSDVIDFKREDCMNLSMDDEKFDAVTAAFGIRNFEHLEQGLCEMHRVLKTGGHLCVAELTRPVCFPMRQLFWIYAHTVLPIYGRMVSKDKKAYRYLTKTIEAFPQGEDMMRILQRVGFRETDFHRLTAGICTMYFATK
ncbi:MAG: bifunctional demethylmenaquinone methyltransferase/2-methoxy-6-polyprenyl-1,4-benzoquinol methylase UbiE [Prevotella sp.]|nr:bifunctional demethylmenaquinone methyltransferase/2-methoxy-6-polyprenyl-1,4-benzoquinol methylase UbiE [Prevotella sp.]